MKVIPEKCHLLTSGSEEVTINAANNNIKNSKCEKLLGVNFDNNIKFDTHIENICRKANEKLNALARLTS